MGHPLLAQLQQNAAFRAGFVVVAMLAVVGVAWGALPISCFAGACKTMVPDATLLVTEPVKTPAPPAPTPAPEPKTQQVAEAKGPTLTQNDVISQTFARLNVDLKLPSETIRAAQLVASVSSDLPAPAAVGEGGLKTRTVKTISVNPDGTPVTDAQVQVATVAEGSPPQPLAETSADDQVSLVAYASTAGPALDGLPVVAALDEVASAKAPVPAKPPVKSASVDTAVVSTAANVRSSPSKGKSKVVFTLAAGETVTVRDKQRGWIKITDDKGRSGWIYEDFLKG